MNRLRMLLLSLLVAACAIAVVRFLWEQHTQKKQDAAFQLVLQRYSAAVRLGTSRKDLETYLHLKSIPFRRVSIGENGTYADITKIGEGDHPWYCHRKVVYIAFQFMAKEQRLNSAAQSPLDPLQQISLFPQLEGCR